MVIYNGSLSGSVISTKFWPLNRSKIDNLFNHSKYSGLVFSMYAADIPPPDNDDEP